MFFRQTHDLGPVGRRAHARLDFMEAVENLIETGLGQTQGGEILREREGVLTASGPVLSIATAAQGAAPGL
ncbi:hypothetical protein GCM10009081_24850 [Brevundimonas nasdae]